jgi:hypothetical protein
LRTLDRAAIERVLARAAELHTGSLDASEGMSEQQLVELGREVGLAPEHLRQALAEERTRVAVPEERSVAGALLGAPHAVASRVVNGTPAQAMSRLDDWMQRQEALRPKRRFADRATWESRRDFVGSLQVGLNLGGRPYGLASADEVGATVVEVDPARVLVRLDADYRAARKRRMAWAAAIPAVAALKGVGLVWLATAVFDGSFFIAAAAATIWTAAGAAVGLAVARSQRRRLARAQLALDQVLDRLEHPSGGAPKSPLAEFLSGLTG